MLYKIEAGTVNETHYGLALARILPFPDGLLERAEFVAHKLERNAQRRKKISPTIIKERRRKLVLSLKEHLVQAHNGVMDGEVLTNWLAELRKEFIKRMSAIDDEIAQAEREVSDQDMELDDGNEATEDESMSSEDGRQDSQPPPKTNLRQPSIISVSSNTTSSSSISSSTVRAVSENQR